MQGASCHPVLYSLDTDTIKRNQLQEKNHFFLSPLFITICLQAETMSNIFVM
jgi:hypothetical protein